MAYDYKDMVQRLVKALRLHTMPVAMKRCATMEELKAIPKIRINMEKTLTACQYIGQAARLGQTIGFTKDTLFGKQCVTSLGLIPKSEAFISGSFYNGVWFGTEEDARKHQACATCVPFDDCAGVAVAPLESGRIENPDTVLIYLTPGQMIYFINGLQYVNYEMIESTVVGESSCTDTWCKAMVTGKPCVSIPCFAERRYGGVPDDEMLICLTPDQILKALDGMDNLSKHGLRYPYAPYGVANDCREGMGVSYSKGQ
jgi:uncharacterized protein (DUF169 family)